MTYDAVFEGPPGTAHGNSSRAGIGRDYRATHSRKIR